MGNRRRIQKKERPRVTPQSAKQQLGHSQLQRRSFDLSAKTPSESEKAVRTTSTSNTFNFANIGIVQPKLTIGQPNDKYEQEADHVAHKVVQQINSPVAETSGATSSDLAQRQDETVQRSALSLLQRQEALEGGMASSELESSINQARGTGQSLDANLQQQMGQAMGADFSNVKIHTDNQADQLNQSIQAKAFTTGQDVFFKKGEYNPASKSGQELIAHELTHVVQQSGAVQRKPSRPAINITPTTGADVPIQRLMTTKAFKEATKGTLFHPRKRITAIDTPLKKIEQSGVDSILLRELLTAIDGWLAVADEESSRRPIVTELREQVTDEMARVSEHLSSDFDPENPPKTRQRSNAFSAEVTGANKKYGSDFSDFDSKQFRVSGRAPNRRIEEVKRTTTEDGTVVYYATGLVTNFKGKAPMIAPYPEPVSLGNWYPTVTHINGMAVAPKSGILSASALQETVNKALDGQDEVAFGQEAVDVLYTYSAQRGGVVVDVIDCIKGKVQIKDESTKKQEELMLDAVRRKQRVTISAHSRGTIKTDNAVRNAHEVLTAEFLPDIRAERYDEVMAYWEENDPGIGIPVDILAELSFSGFAAEEVKKQMNEYIHLVYAGNAVQHPSAFVDINLFVGGLDPISMFVGTYSETGRKIDAAIGTGGSKNSKLHSVGKTKGHSFVGNYVPAVGQEIAEDIKKR